MGIVQSLENRRSQYVLTRTLPVPQEAVIETVTRVTELVPDSFNSRSARVVILFGEQHDAFCAGLFEAFSGKLTEKKVTSFRSAAGTILFFYDEAVVQGLQEKFPRYHDNFPLWAREANGMLQISVWTALRDLEIGATLQHYNPVIDGMVQELCGVPESWKLIAQMPFGGIAAPPAEKAGEDITQRVKVLR